MGHQYMNKIQRLTLSTRPPESCFRTRAIWLYLGDGPQLTAIFKNYNLQATKWLGIACNALQILRHHRPHPARKHPPLIDH